MTASAAVELLLPSFLHFVGIAASALLSTAAVVAWTRLPRPRNPTIAVPIACLATACIGVFLSLVAWTEGLGFGEIMATRFEKRCRTAGLTIHRRLPGAQGVLVMSQLEHYVHYGYMGPPSAGELLATANIRFVEREGGGPRESRYVRISKPYAEAQVDESLADVVITMKTLTNGGEMKAGVFGEEMTIVERPTGQLLATLRYFWTTPRPIKTCPSPKDGLHTAQIASYVVGLWNPEMEQRWREAFIP